MYYSTTTDRASTPTTVEADGPEEEVETRKDIFETYD
jgi:hypothetical protein